MQKKRPTALQQACGDKPCDHPAFAKEYDNGERTGNYVCTQCGTTGHVPSEGRAGSGPPRLTHQGDATKRRR